MYLQRVKTGPVIESGGFQRVGVPLPPSFNMLSRLCIVLVATLSYSLCPAAETKTIYGVHEKVQLLGQQMEAKLDTGAETASLNAHHIELFKRGKDEWVRFSLSADDDPSNRIERPVKRISRIKRRKADIAECPPCECANGSSSEEDEEDGGDSQGGGETHTARPVIELPVCIGNKQHKIEVNLTDRSHFKYPFLLGTKGLKAFKAMVDPAVQFTAGESSCGQE